jgi:hypothetical protein
VNDVREGGEWGDPETRKLVEKAAAFNVQPSPSARARVWARLDARRRPRIWRLAWGMFALGAVSALVAVLLVGRRPSQSIEPSALVIAADGSQKLVARGDRLPLARDLALVDLHGAGRMVAGADTVARLVRFGADGVELRLERGSLLAHVTPRPAGAPFVVRTPRFTARVVGTILRVAVHADGTSSLAVAHGVVEVQPLSGPPLLVRAGDRWPVESTDLPSDAELARLGAADVEDASTWSFAPAAPAALSPLHDESALYAAGDRALKESHDPRAALGLWEEQRRRFPTGVLRRDADASIVDALVALKQPARALAEVDALLAVDPAGLRADELHFVRGTLLRAVDGSCRRARAELDRALQRPSDPWAARARAARAACKETR